MNTSEETETDLDQPSIAQPTLSKEQETIYRWTVQEKKNVFFTGSAGSGKSYLIKAILTGYKQLGYSDGHIAITATTGIAAYFIGGQTIHSFSGGHLLDEDVGTIISKIRNNIDAKARWQNTKVLILDEISMLLPEVLDKLDRAARVIRRNLKVPFGGIQLIFTGDFFQLPPVRKHGENTGYAFHAECWEDLFKDGFQVRLTRIYRQNDDTFKQMLEEVRFGELSSDTIATFQQLRRTTKTEKDSDGLIQPVKLFPTRSLVDGVNERKLEEIQRDLHTFMADDYCALPEVSLSQCLKDLLAPKKLDLKMGCKVMLIYNLNRELVNGTIGVVLGFCSLSDFDILRNNGFDWDSIDPRKVTDKEIKALMREKKAQSNGPEFPVVRFMNKRNDTDSYCRTEILDRVEWKVKVPKELRSSNLLQAFQNMNLEDGECNQVVLDDDMFMATRKQIPLILAYALTIHKAQGQTLPLVMTDLQRCFAPGQVYVALSRAESLEGLQVMNFRPDLVMADPSVIEFNSTLQVIQ